MGSSSPSRLSHLETLRADVRDEIKRRIDQRDKYSIQLTVALSALLAVAFSKPRLARVLIAAPLTSIYFTVLILYSYRIHHVLARYLRDMLEPELATAADSSVELEIETYYSHHAVPGIRRAFFIASLWVVSTSSLLYLFVYEASGSFSVVLSVLSVVYLGACAVITWGFRK
jgi:hypothetical protein